MRRLEVLPEYCDTVADLKRLTRKYVEIYIIRFLYKVRSDVRRLNELHESVALLVSGTEHDDLWRAVGNHINGVNEFLGEGCYRGL